MTKEVKEEDESEEGRERERRARVNGSGAARNAGLWTHQPSFAPYTTSRNPLCSTPRNTYIQGCSWRVGGSKRKRRRSKARSILAHLRRLDHAGHCVPKLSSPYRNTRETPSIRPPPFFFFKITLSFFFFFFFAANMYTRTPYIFF